MKLEVKAVKHLDIKDKEQNYIVIGEAENKVIINVGEKTYNSVKNLTDGNPKTTSTGNKVVSKQ